MLHKNTATETTDEREHSIELLFSPIRTITVGSRITLDLLTSVLSPKQQKDNDDKQSARGLHKIIIRYFMLPPVGTFTLP
ncbi:hypothetical protein Xentx_02168 [Xenorhabdus thuongxuanensis]|uniref:Uncharacterized protein n=1 Tax=Xenorhabdus thuongxuanensis TaxID=1873484 RepID=A0A1Q5U144_9GAMM|nr:hypothetical protein Xentx_02168 [Xenorhabdus thuongxuanensis]